MAHMEMLKRDLSLITHQIVDNDEDWFVGIDGYERKGKTTLALQMALHCNPKFSVDDIVFTPKEFRQRVLNSHPGDVILVDEGALVFHAQEGNTREGRKIIKLATVMGKYNTMIITCVPKITVIHKYIREHRLKTYIRVYKKGTYAVYNKPALNKYVQILGRGGLRKGQRYPPYLYRERFGGIHGELWESYLEKKSKQIQEYEDFDDSDPNEPKSLRDSHNNNTVGVRALLSAPGVPVTCDKCGYEWNYKGKRLKPGCPSCGNVMRLQQV